MSKIQTIEILDIENVKIEKMRYQKNSLGYILGFGGIIFSVLASFIALNSMRPGYVTIIKILMNVFILLFGFLTCEKVKAYKKEYSFVMFGFAIVCVLRIFWVPLQLITAWGDYKKGAELASTDSVRSKALISKAEKILGNSMISNSKTNAYLGQSGYLRAALCIILLLTAASFFAISGYVSYSKTTKLNKYLNNLESDDNDSKNH